jgi:hypothetical protein
MARALSQPRAVARLLGSRPVIELGTRCGCHTPLWLPCSRPVFDPPSYQLVSDSLFLLDVALNFRTTCASLPPDLSVPRPLGAPFSLWLARCTPRETTDRASPPHRCSPERRRIEPRLRTAAPPRDDGSSLASADLEYGREVTDPYKIRNHYVRTWFAIDLISSLPLAFLNYATGGVPDIASLNKLLRVLKVTNAPARLPHPPFLMAHRRCTPPPRTGDQARARLPH